MDEDSVTFSQSQYYYLDGADTVNVYWVAFSDSTLLSLPGDKLFNRDNSLDIFPNPAVDFISLRINENFGAVTRIDFFDALGQVVLMSGPSHMVDVTRLPSGLFFVRVTNNKGMTVISKLRKF